MGSLGGAECCKLVGSYLLNLLGDLIDKNNTCLNRDDGLVIFENLSGPQIDRQRKRIIRVFKDCDLNISFSTN